MEKDEKRRIKQIENHLPTILETLRTWESLSRFIYLYRYFQLFQILKQLHPHDVLDVGCGGGLLLDYLKEESVSLRYVGIDISKRKINYAHRNSKRFRRNAHFVIADAEFLPLKSNSVDTVVLTEVLEHLLNVKKLLLRHEECCNGMCY